MAPSYGTPAINTVSKMDSITMELSEELRRYEALSNERKAALKTAGKAADELAELRRGIEDKLSWLKRVLDGTEPINPDGLIELDHGPVRS